MRRTKQGFSLIELMVVLTIMAVLATVVFLMVRNHVAHRRDVRRIADLDQFQKALDLYYAKYNFYPCGDVNAPPDVAPFNSKDNLNNCGFYRLSTDLTAVTRGCTGDMSLDTSFLNGCTDLNGDNDCEDLNEATYCWVQRGSIALPRQGLYAEGMLPSAIPRDPVNGTIGSTLYYYRYDVSMNRDLYVLGAWLEQNHDKELNDGGRCDNIYEVGPGVGIMNPWPINGAADRCD